MKAKNILLLIFILLASLVGIGCSCNKNSQKSNTTIYKPVEETIIYTQAILKKDLENRLKPFINENVNPIRIIDDLDNQSYDIAIVLNSAKDSSDNIEEIYSKEISLSPNQFRTFFQDKVSKLVISSITKINTQITQAIKDYLKKSYQDNPPQENKLVFTGCILLSRWVALRSQQNNDYTYPFHYTANITKNADLTIGNLETPFAETGPYTRLGTVFRGDPRLVEGLVYSGFNVVNLANNHFGDSGRAGMNYTFKLLDKNNIDYFGAGTNINNAREPLIKEINGVKYAFLGYADGVFTPNSYAAKADYTGLNLLNIDNLKTDLRKVKDKADFIIVSMHSGTEYTHNPNQTQINFAHTAIELGADMVFGHHPHVVQAIEYYKDKPIFYSLGNFVMDQYFPNTNQGYILKIKTIFNQITSVELIPYHIYDYSQPKTVKDDEANQILDNVINASKILSGDSNEKR